MDRFTFENINKKKNVSKKINWRCKMIEKIKIQCDNSNKFQIV